MISGSSASILPLFGIGKANVAAAQLRQPAIGMPAQVRQPASEMPAAAPAARIERSETPASVPLCDPAMFPDQLRKDKVALQNGTLSPLDQRALAYHPEDSKVEAAGGRLNEGVFAEGVLGCDYRPRYADFSDRQVAMLNAYHYASDLSVEARLAALSLNAIAGGKGGSWYQDADMATREVARNSTLLAYQFNFTTEVLSVAADGRAKTNAFEVRHEDFGLLLSVDEAGKITFYDQAGQAYEAADYAAARPDGIIPELLNDLAERRGPLDVRL